METFTIDDRGLYQSGSLLAAGPEDAWLTIRRLNIDTVMDLEGELDPSVPVNEIVYLYWPIEDAGLPDIETLQLLSSFLHGRFEQDHKILVHCAAGINRSSLMNGSILHWDGLSGPEIVDRIITQRPGALTNTAFRDYLHGLS